MMAKTVRSSRRVKPALLPEIRVREEVNRTASTLLKFGARRGVALPAPETEREREREGER